MQTCTLITGATGFIGRHLTRQLVRNGELVRVLVRQRDKGRRLFGRDVEIHEGDVRDVDSLRRACFGVETIYNIAGIYRFGFRHARELWETNVTGTENLMSQAAVSGVQRIVHLSSASLLATVANRPDRLMSEEDFPASAPVFSFYKRSKWYSEKCALEWARRGLPVSIASVGCPIGGEDETPTPTGQMVRDFMRGNFPFYCHTGLNFIDIRDFCVGLQSVAEHGRPGERYLLGDQNLHLREFLKLLEEETGLPAPKRCLPQAVICLAGCGGEVFDFLSRRGATARVCVETGWQSRYFQYFDSFKAHRELGWRPVHSVRQGLQESIRWFREPMPMGASQPLYEEVVSGV